MATNNSINSNDPINVALGGTGATTFTSHGVLLGEGTGAITATAVGSSGNTLIGGTGVDPAWNSLTSPNGSVAYTFGSHSVNLDVNNWQNETSFSPTLAFGGSTTGITYVIQQGYYTRIDKLVIFVLNLNLSSKGSQTGSATINLVGLPNAQNTSGYPNYSAFTITYQIVTFTGIVAANMQGSTNSVNLDAVTSGSITALTNTAFANNSGIYLAGHYFTA